MKKLYLIFFLLFFSICCFGQSRYISETTKKVVFARDGGKCQCCGSFENLEYDHITPYSCGGTSTVSNIQLLCRKCNRSKSNSCYCKIHHRKVGTNCCQGNGAITSSYRSSPVTYNKSSTSRQCTGITKKGNRCKNRTTNPNGRCYLHQ
ncbi:HNH endonuclease [Chryseobacterium sp. SC28]|uniref:HNH endonuclease n=1 Tax=Chryseobacterium sp. SC28 TaxID=2268028 RepID=UPI000F655F57|nr:HNH endonuclease [Chryseobacterium sp. SC28]